MLRYKYKNFKIKKGGKIMKVILTSRPSFQGYSLEAGKNDGQNHFDHHGYFAGQPSPCNNEVIKGIGVDGVVEITHIDSDTFVGLLRMAGATLPKKIDLQLLEAIDCNGSSIVTNKNCPTLHYFVGVGQLSRRLGFPRVTEEPQDVTSLVEAMMASTEEEILSIGREAMERSEQAYTDTLVHKEGLVGFWAIGPNDPLDPSRPYEDGVEVVVVYRSHFKTVSVYCSPKSNFAFGGKTVAGVAFGGHPKAAGSPRGTEMSLEDAKKVYEEISKEINS
jgi:hypothetical protein